MLEAVGDQAQRERLHSRRRLLLGSPICGHAREGWDVRQPAAILLAIILDGE